MSEVRAMHGAIAEMAALARPVLRGTCMSRCNGGNAKGLLAAPVRPELAALGLPAHREQSSPSSDTQGKIGF